MSLTPQEVVARQVQRLRRRLWAQTLLHGIILGWTGCLLLGAAYFVGRSLARGQVPEEEGYIALAAALTTGLLFGALYAFLRAPSSVAAALALDGRFELKERVTTFCSLDARQAATPAGQALVEDVHRHVAGLDLASKFPLHLRWSQAMMPLCAGVLGVCAFFLSPYLDVTGLTRRLAQNNFVVDPKEVQVQLDNLKKAHYEREKEEPTSKEMKDIQDQFDQLLKKELDPKNEDQVRETLQAMRNLEEKMKERLQNLKELNSKSKDLKNMLDQLDKLGKKMKDGPANEFQDALTKANFKKALEELDKLQKKVDNNELSKKEQDQLAQQLQDLKDRLQRLHDQKDERDKLQKDFEDGKIDQEQLQREMDRLNQEMQEMQDLQELADLLEECKACAGGGDGKGLSGKLEKLKGKLKALDVDEEEMRRLLEEAERLEAARIAMLGACQGRCEGKMNGLGNGKNPGGKRPIGEEPNAKISEQRQQGDTDPNGKIRVTGFTKGGMFSKIPAKEVGGAFQQAVQQAPEVIDRQRIPADAADIAKGYFNKLGNQK